jgi:hypothetical protein
VGPILAKIALWAGFAALFIATIISFLASGLSINTFVLAAATLWMFAQAVA